MKVGVLVALAVAFAPAAHAQSGCALIQKLVASSETTFADIKGEETWSNSYETSTSMSGAYECSIELREVSEYQCSWVRKNGEEGQAWAAALTAAVAECLPSWTRADIAGRKSFNGLTIGSGAAFAGNRVSIEAYHEVVDATETLVWFRVMKAG